MKFFRILIGCLLVGITATFSGPVAADNNKLNSFLNAKYGIWIGGFFPKVDSEVLINGKIIDDGPILDIEDTLGLTDRKTVLWGGASWRISQRNNLEIEFNNLNRTGSTTVVFEDIQIGDSIAKVGAKIDTTFNLAIGRLTYGYSVVRREKMEVELKAGFHLAATSVKLQLSGAVEVCQPGEVPPDCSALEGSTDQLETQDFALPLPHLGASFSYALLPTLSVRVQAMGFAIEINDYKGALIEFDADVVYEPWQHFGFGVGFRYFNANIKSKGGFLKGEFDYEYFGPVLYGRVSF